MTKKEAGSLMTRDFTDEIYDPATGIPAEMFVEKFNSEMFTNLLIVASQDRYDGLM